MTATNAEITPQVKFLNQHAIQNCCPCYLDNLQRLLSNLIGVYYCVSLLVKEKFCDNEWSVVLNPFDNHILISVDVNLVRQMW